MAEERARIEYLRVENFRALKRVEFKDLSPLTALLGPNGSGKSTVFQVFAFLAECFGANLRAAWDHNGRAREIKTRGSNGPVVIEIKYRETGYPLITYHLEIDEFRGSPAVLTEWMQWRRGSQGKPFRFLDYERGRGRAIRGDQPDSKAERAEIPLKSEDLIAVNALGQFADHPRVAALRSFIGGWHVSYLSLDQTRAQPEAGPQERLSRTGDNLANVIQYLAERAPQRLEQVFAALRRRVPRIDKVVSDVMPDGRLLLQIKDAPFESPVLAKFVSDGTLKMLAYLVLLYDPAPPPFIGIEEPENFLHPRLLPELAEECRKATSRSQMLITTHSPFFVNSLQPEEVRILFRNPSGYTEVQRAADIPGVKQFMEVGASLGDLWMEGHLGGDPLVRAGMPVGTAESS
jgi:predicted ATPase